MLKYLRDNVIDGGWKVVGSVSTSCITGTTDLDDMVYVPVKNEDLWKIKFVKELINTREGFLYVENFEDDEVNEVLEYLCTS